MRGEAVARGGGEEKGKTGRREGAGGRREGRGEGLDEKDGGGWGEDDVGLVFRGGAEEEHPDGDHQECGLEKAWGWEAAAAKDEKARGDGRASGELEKDVSAGRDGE